MQSLAVATAQSPAQQQPPKSETRPDRLTPRVRTAIDAMVWQGKPYDEAAKEAGLTTRAMRLALGKPHVMAYLNQQRHLLRSSEGPRNIHRLREIRDAADNMPAVNAIKVLEQLGDEQTHRNSGVSDSPGVTIQILNVTQSAPQVSADILTKTVASE